MTQKSLNYEQMGIAAKDVFVQMGYRDASPDESTLRETLQVMEEVLPVTATTSTRETRMISRIRIALFCLPDELL